MPPPQPSWSRRIWDDEFHPRRRDAPITVANFLNYVNSGRYFTDDSVINATVSLFFHRAVTNFVIQSGGFHGNGE